MYGPTFNDKHVLVAFTLTSIRDVYQAMTRVLCFREIHVQLCQQRTMRVLIHNEAATDNAVSLRITLASASRLHLCLQSRVAPTAAVTGRIWTRTSTRIPIIQKCNFDMRPISTLANTGDAPALP